MTLLGNPNTTGMMSGGSSKIEHRSHCVGDITDIVLFGRLRVEERVRVSTPSLVMTAKVNTLNITAVACGEKHVLVLSDEGVSYLHYAC